MKKKEYQSPEIEIANWEFEEICSPFDNNFNNYLMSPSSGEEPNRSVNNYWFNQ